MCVSLLFLRSSVLNRNFYRYDGTGQSLRSFSEIQRREIHPGAQPAGRRPVIGHRSHLPLGFSLTAHTSLIVQSISHTMRFDGAWDEARYTVETVATLSRSWFLRICSITLNPPTPTGPQQQIPTRCRGNNWRQDPVRITGPSQAYSIAEKQEKMNEVRHVCGFVHLSTDGLCLLHPRIESCCSSSCTITTTTQGWS